MPAARTRGIEVGYDPAAWRALGNSGLSVTQVGIGGAGIAGRFRPVSRRAAIEIIQQAWSAGIRYFDTAPLYGLGRSEERLGRAIADVPRDSYVLSSKVGMRLERMEQVQSRPRPYARGGDPRLDAVYDFSQGGLSSSLAASLERLSTSYLDIVFLHDPDEGRSPDDRCTRQLIQRAVQVYPSLERFCAEGQARVAGLAMTQWKFPTAFARYRRFDSLLLAGRYTLLDQSALLAMLPLAQQQGIGVIIGGPYNSGILAQELGKPVSLSYRHASAPPDVLIRVRALHDACKNHGVPLKAAALQFPLAHPAVASVIPGIASINELTETLELTKLSLPPALWVELKARGLIPQDAPVPSGYCSY